MGPSRHVGMWSASYRDGPFDPNGRQPRMLSWTGRPGTRGARRWERRIREQGTAGKLRIYLGAAPGVGKTYAMLAEGQRRRTRGTDVVGALIETHGRRLTAAMAEGLEIVPRRAMNHRGATLTEMDLDAVLARHPRVALVDELAHTNVPGCRHTKRWQDVDELLDVRHRRHHHAEHPAPGIAQDRGAGSSPAWSSTRPCPTTMARRADQIELVDMTPEALRRRMVHGNVYPPDRIEAALTHYFRPGTSPHCASWPCCGWPTGWRRACSGTGPNTASPRRGRPGSGSWSASPGRRRR